MAKRKRTYKKRAKSSPGSKRRYSYKTTKRRRSSKKSTSYFSSEKLSPEVTRGILVVFLFVLCGISLLSLFDLAGAFGQVWSKVLQSIFGWQAYILPLVMLILGGAVIVAQKRSSDFEIKNGNYFGIFLFTVCLSGLFHIFFPADQALDIIDQYRGGGYLGFAVSYPLQMLMGVWGTAIILIALVIVGFILMFNVSFRELVNFLASIKVVLARLLNKIKDRIFPEETLKVSGMKSQSETMEANRRVKDKDENQPEPEDEDVIPKLEVKSLQDSTGKSKTKSVSKPLLETSDKNWRPYPLDLLERKSALPTSGDIKSNAKMIHRALRNFGIEVEMGEVNIGPTVTQYTFKPAEGIKLSRITALNNDLSLALAAHPLRIEAPIPGRSLVGIEVPNQAAAIVRLRGMLESDEFQKRTSPLSIALGRNVAGSPVVVDLKKMPHLLIAGATGSGKSICLNSLLLTLLWQNSPANLKLILVDPKKVEMTSYNNLPHLLTPIVTDVDKTVNALRWTVSEMERRFELFSQAGRRDIESYNAAAGDDKVPYIVVAIDELADLMAVAAHEVEACIVRLAQMARAVGIHLMLATQRPSVNVITGLIKANITSRIAFAVASQIDSRTIIDTAGADKLLGNGDLLYITSDLGKPRRVQGAFVSEKEIKGVTNYLKKDGEPEYHEEVTKKQITASIPGLSSDSDVDDDLFDEAKETVIAADKASASLLQRRLRIGYARAARLLDLLEEQGIVGPADGARPRDILIADSQSETGKGGTAEFEQSQLED